MACYLQCKYECRDSEGTVTHHVKRYDYPKTKECPGPIDISGQKDCKCVDTTIVEETGKGVLAKGAIGAAVGAGAGSFFPVVGTAVGGLIGGLIGLGVGYLS